MHHFPLAAQSFSLSLVFRSLIMVCFGTFWGVYKHFTVLCTITQYNMGKADIYGMQAYFSLIFLASQDSLLSFQVSKVFK